MTPTIEHALTLIARHRDPNYPDRRVETMRVDFTPRASIGETEIEDVLEHVRAALVLAGYTVLEGCELVAKYGDQA